MAGSVLRSVLRFCCSQKSGCPRLVSVIAEKWLSTFSVDGWLGFVSRKVAVHVLSEKWLSTFSGPFKCQGLASFL